MREDAFPEWLEPMAATLTQERFTGPEWIFERKLDGIRLLAFKNGTDVRLLSRNRLPQHLPSIVEAIAKLPQPELILDGEVTGYELQSIAFDPSANVRLYRLLVTMNLRYRDVKEEKLLFERRGYQERADFRVAGIVSDTIAREQGALRTAAVDIARAIVAFTLERF